MAHTHLCDYARTTISCTAQRLIGRHGFLPQDREDIEQDLTCDLLMRLRNFDPKRGTRKAFIARRIEAAASNLIRKRKAGKRQVTFDNNIAYTSTDGGDDESVSRVDVLIDESLDEATRLHELREDVNDALSTLPSDLRMIANDLKHRSERSVAAKHGISRRQLRHHMKRIRTACARRGITPTN